MKAINNIIKGTDKILDVCIYIFLIIILLFGGYAIWQNIQVYNLGKLPDDILKYQPTDNESFSLEELEKINPDICGWIELDNTNINYPIVKGKDNVEYLNQSYKKEYSILGSIFMDYRNEANFSDNYTLIYGHNMNGNLMFADVTAYRKEDFFNSHLTGKLYTKDKNYLISVFAYDEASAYSNIVYNISSYKQDGNNTTEALQYFKKNAEVYKEIGIQGTDKIIALSTCYGVGNSSRSLVIAKIEEIKKDEIKDSQELNTEEVKKIGQRNDKYKMVLICIIIIIVILVVVVLISMYIAKKIKKRNKKLNK